MDFHLRLFLSAFLSLVIGLQPSISMLPVAFASADDNVQTKPKTARKKLRFDLVEGKPAVEKAESIKVANATALPPERLEQLIKRLPPMKTANEQAFSLPEQSEKRPSSSKVPSTTLEATAPAKPKEQAPAELRVTNLSPEGPVDTVTEVAVSFSQPMVPISDLGTVNNPKNLPLNMTPQMEGKWRWANTQSLVFDPAGGKLPNATTFKCTVPATTTSTLGGTMKTAKTWEFSTTRPEITNIIPYRNSMGLNPTFLLICNQKLNKTGLIKSIKLTGSSKTWALNSVSIAEARKDPELTSYIGVKTDESVKFAFKPVETLPKNTKFKLTIPSGISSLEGPLKTKEAKVQEFSTYGPLNFNKPDTFGQSSFIAILFNNPLDEKKFKPTMVKFEPPVEEVKFQISGEQLNASGSFQPNFKYKVTFDKSMADIYGQTLGTTRSTTVQTGQVHTYLSPPEPRVRTIPAHTKPIFTFNASAMPYVKASISRINPEAWPKMETFDSSDGKNLPIARGTDYQPLKTLKVPIGPRLKDAEIDLAPYLKEGRGQFLIVLETPEAKPKQRYWSWVQVTDIGLDAYTAEMLTAFTSSLKDGTPLDGVTVSVHPLKSSATTNADGLATLDLPPKQIGKVLIARKGSDAAIVTHHTWSDESWSKPEQAKPKICWHTVTDRNLYKLGEKVLVKGWLRGNQLHRDGSTTLFDPRVKSIKYTVNDSTGKELLAEKIEIDKPEFDFSFEIPQTASLGSGTISFQVEETDDAANLRDGIGPYFDIQPSGIEFKINDFRRPEFELSMASSRGTSLLLGDQTTLTAKTNYFAGGTLQNAKIDWNVTASKTTFAPAGWSDYTFGTASPWIFRSSYATEKSKNLSGFTDASGQHSVDLKFTSFEDSSPISCKCEATVYDVNRQSWSTQTAILVHPCDRCAGLKTDRWYYSKGDKVSIDAIVTDLTGKAVPDVPIQLKLVALDDEDKETIVEEQSIKSGDSPKQITFTASKSGRCQIRSSIADNAGRTNETRIETWIQGEVQPSVVSAEQETVNVIADKEEYKPGDQATLLIKAPFAPASGVLTLRRGAILKVIPVKLTSLATTVKVDISEKHFPLVTAEVDISGKEGRFASGSVDLSVPPVSKMLNLTSTAKDPDLEPGSDTTIQVDLKDATDKPVQGRVALAVVDEAILALANYSWGDPTKAFYIPVPDNTTSNHSRESVRIYQKRDKPVPEERRADDLSALPPPSAMPPPPVPGAADGGLPGLVPPPPPAVSLGTAGAQAEPSPIKLRTDLSALALFASVVEVGPDGKAEVKLHLPDSVTRYRIMAIATSGLDLFGSDESTLNARLPLMVKPSAPRFLNVGDSCELPVVLQNQTDKPLSVELAMRAATPSTVTAGKSIEVPPKDRVEVRFPILAEAVGPAKFQFAAASGTFADAQEVTLPVRLPASSETFAAVGQIDEGAVKNVFEPMQNVFEDVGGLEVTTSSTAVQELADAYFYLKEYTYGCSEQISSRMLAMLALEKVVSAFGSMTAEDQVKLKEWVKKDIKELVARQNASGGFALWKPGERDAWPYVSLQVARALLLAKEKDYAVPRGTLDKCVDYLKTIDSHIPKEYRGSSELSLKAYALFLRSLNNDYDPTAARELIRKALKPLLKKSKNNAETSLASLSDSAVTGALPLECVGWLLPVISTHKASTEEATLLRRVIANSIRETSTTATVDGTGYGDDNYFLFYYPGRNNAIVLEALIADQPNNPAIRKLVRGLLSARKQGKWDGTQANGYNLIALEKYFSKYEGTTPNFTAQEWLGDDYVGSQKFAGRSTQSQSVSIPMSFLSKQKTSRDLLLNKVGKGRMYYRVALNYASKNLNLAPMENGFSINRTYEGVDNPNDVKKDADGTWHFKAGSTVRVKLNFVAKSARFHVAVCDPLAAGTEPLNPELSGSRQTFPKKDQQEEVDEVIEEDNSNNQSFLPPPVALPPPPPPSPYGNSMSFSANDFAGCILPFWQWTWFDHQNLRDYQAEAFANVLGGGSYEYTYLIRATTPGVYTAAPAKAEEMYSSETFGRTATDKVIVE